MFPFDVYEEDGVLKWFLWECCAAHVAYDVEARLHELEDEVQKRGGANYLWAYVKYHQRLQLTKYQSERKKPLRTVSCI